jgi:hypothetical protein
MAELLVLLVVELLVLLVLWVVELLVVAPLVPLELLLVAPPAPPEPPVCVEPTAVPVLLLPHPIAAASSVTTAAANAIQPRGVMDPSLYLGALPSRVEEASPLRGAVVPVFLRDLSSPRPDGQRGRSTW